MISEERKKRRKTKLFVVLGILFLLVLIIVVFSNSMVTTAEYEIKSEEIPEGFDGCKIIQISDYHNEWGSMYDNRLLEKIKSTNGDYIFITGDFVDSLFSDVEQSVDFAKKLVKIAPVYYVDGNHEYDIEEEQREKLWAGLKACGVKVLENESVMLERGDDKIELLGAYGTNYDITEKDGFTIMLNHFPEDARYYSHNDNSPDLIFSGHAHGGLICLPFLLDGLYAPGQGFFPEYTNGKYEISDTTLIVSRGVGNSGYTLRFCDPFQLVVCTLKCK